MPAGNNTKCNSYGIRRVCYGLASPDYRNFELNGTQQYKVVTCKPYVYNGAAYAQGATIPYDAGSVYSNYAQLERDFNAGWLDPIN